MYVTAMLYIKKKRCDLSFLDLDESPSANQNDDTDEGRKSPGMSKDSTADVNLLLPLVVELNPNAPEFRPSIDNTPSPALTKSTPGKKKIFHLLCVCQGNF